MRIVATSFLSIFFFLLASLSTATPLSATSVAGIVSTSLDLIPSSSGELLMIFEFRASKKPRRKLTLVTALNVIVESTKIEPLLVPSSFLHGWFLDENHPEELYRRELWTGAVLNPGESSVKVEFKLPSALFAGEGRPHSAILVLRTLRELDIYSSDLKQKVLFAPITSVTLKPREYLRLVDRTGWKEVGRNVWRAEIPRNGVGHLRAEFEKFGEWDNVFLIISGVLVILSVGFGSGRILSRIAEKQKREITGKWYLLLALLLFALVILMRLKGMIVNDMILSGSLAFPIGFGASPYIPKKD